MLLYNSYYFSNPVFYFVAPVIPALPFGSTFVVAFFLKQLSSSTVRCSRLILYIYSLLQFQNQPLLQGALIPITMGWLEIKS